MPACRFVVFLAFAILLPAAHASSAFIYLTDLHIGEGCNSSAAGYNSNDTDCYSVRDLIASIVKVNSLVGNSSLVIVGGDITSSAQASEFAAAKHMLDQLESPYLPIMGNHGECNCDPTQNMHA
jgi:3',5'-cyclic AMP phosphodiesterase CpdA